MAKKISYKLVAKYFTGNCSEAEKLEIENWRDANTDNLHVFNQYRTIWENAKKPKEIFTPDIEKALKNVNSNIPVIPSPEDKRNIKPLVFYISRVAAAILVGISVWLLVTLINPKQEMPDYLVAFSDTAKMELTLADGTHIWLNKNTLVRYPVQFEGIERKIFVEGEAYFNVAKNAQMPFVIETENAVVKVLGTQFNLRARKTEPVTEVVVTEGKVAFTAKSNKEDAALYLLAGDKGIVNHQNMVAGQEKNLNPNVLAWKTGVLVFENTPLSIVVRDLSDCFGINIEIAALNNPNVPFTSVFENKPLDEILIILEKTLGVKAQKYGHKIILGQ